MHGFLKGIRSMLWTPAALVVVALAACAPAPTPAPTRPPSAQPTRTALPVATPAPQQTSGPILIPTPTPTLPAPTSTSAASSTLATITYIKMIDLMTGWAEGEVGTDGEIHILRTSDGGATWRDVSPVLVDRFGQDAFFLDALLAWVWNADLGESWRTQDGGQSWTPVENVGWTHTIWFNDSQHGWRLNAESWGLSFVQFDIVSFATTQDGGQTWGETNPPPGGGPAFMAYPDAQTAWAIRAGFAKTIEGVPNLGIPFSIHTTFDGGRTWKSQTMPLPDESFPAEIDVGGPYLGGVGNCDFVSPVYSSTAIWKLALTCEDLSWLYTTTNQGKTWIISPMPAGLEADIQFINPTTGWLALRDPLSHSQGHLYQTTNGGQSWTLLKRTGWTGVQLDFLDAQTGWAVACSDAWYCYQDDARHALVKTTDGGQTWQIIEPQLAP